MHTCSMSYRGECENNVATHAQRVTHFSDRHHELNLNYDTEAKLGLKHDTSYDSLKTQETKRRVPTVQKCSESQGEN